MDRYTCPRKAGSMDLESRRVAGPSSWRLQSRARVRAVVPVFSVVLMSYPIKCCLLQVCPVLLLCVHPFTSRLFSRRTLHVCPMCQGGFPKFVSFARFGTCTSIPIHRDKPLVVHSFRLPSVPLSQCCPMAHDCHVHPLGGV